VQKALYAVTPDKKPEGKKNPNDSSGIDFVKAVLNGTLAALEVQKAAASAQQLITTGKGSVEVKTKKADKSDEGESEV